MVTSKDFPTICRLCMCSGELQSLSELTTINLLTTLIQIDINADNLPKNICNECSIQLDNISKFVEHCQASSTNLELIKNSTKIDIYLTETDQVNDEINYEVEEDLLIEFECFECGETSSTKRGLAAHMVSHRKDQIYECPDCPAKFSYAKYLTRHTPNTHGTKPFVCQICQEGFLRKRALDDHMNFHTGDTPYICSYCGQRFKVARHFNKHTYLLHNPNLSKIPKNKRKYAEKRVQLTLKCDECGKMYSSRSGYANHKLIHKGIKKFLCNVCGKQFLANAQLQNHIKCHKELTKHFSVLEEPKKTFTKNSKLKANIKKHLNNLICELCEKRFSYMSQLKTHMRVHNGEKPYMCSVCGKLFSQKQTLTVHMRIHYGFTPFECDQCDKKYHDSTNLRRHVTRHH